MKECIVAIRMLAVLTVLTGMIYPIFVTITAQLFYSPLANGSVLVADGKAVGSALLAQNFTNSTFFWPRPSAADYATVASGASNKGPTSVDLRKAVAERAEKLRLFHHIEDHVPLPAELLFASGSGLDPHLSPEAVRFQMERVAEARQLTPKQKDNMARLIESLVELPQWGFLGEPRINVLKLNLALDSIR